MSILPSELLTRIQGALERHQEGRALYNAYQEQTGTSRSWRHLDRIEQMAWEDIANGMVVAYNEGHEHGRRFGALLGIFASWAAVTDEPDATDTRAPSPITVTHNGVSARCHSCDWFEATNDDWAATKEAAHRHIRHTGHRTRIVRDWTLAGELDLNLPSDSIPS